MGVFDVVGPVMIGPSSSHTAGAARIGLMAREILKDEPKKAVITVYGSFAKTYKGHGTDRALVAGLLGFSADDVRLRTSFAIAADQGLAIEFHRSDEEVDHPNTVRIAMTGASGRCFVHGSGYRRRRFPQCLCRRCRRRLPGRMWDGSGRSRNGRRR